MELKATMPEEKPEEWSESRFLWSVKSSILEELVGLLDASGKISNPKKKGLTPKLNCISENHKNGY